MDKNINIGDICIYSYDNHNKSISVVEVVKEIPPESAKVKFHQVICDDSGNDFFTYMQKTGHTMNVSKKYLKPISLVNEQRAEIARLKANNRPIYKSKKWKLGNSFGWWKIPFCPHCKRQLGIMAEELKVEKCPMCNKPIKWEEGADNEL